MSHGHYQNEFDRLLREHLIPEFCSDPARRMQLTGFKEPATAIADEDCRHFLRAWQAGLLNHVGRGQYRAPMSAAHEQFFNSGPKGAVDPAFYLSIEPIITVGALARMHFDHGWPPQLLGLQSKGYACDLVAHLDPSGPAHIACEVKKSAAEVELLVVLMHDLGGHPNVDVPLAGPRRNAWKKVDALRREKMPTFWALGPAGLSRVFEVKRSDDVIWLVEVASDALNWRAPAHT